MAARPDILLSAPALERRPGSLELACTVTGIAGRSAPARAWLRFPEAAEQWISQRGEVFLPALLPLAMTTGQDLVVEGEVSQRLLRSCAQIQALYRRWWPRMRPVSIRPAAIHDESASAGEVGCFFTAGVDSFYTVLESLRGDAASRRIRHLVYVEGFDVALAERALRDSVRTGIESAAQALGLPLRIATTNLRELTDPHVPWLWVQHGGSLAAVGLALSPLLGELRIAASDIASIAVPLGSHPLLDPLWSTEATRFVHSGGEASRIQKLAWRIAASPTALDHLRVCWENRGGRYNCGRCEKCLRTMISLRAVGALERCRRFERRLDLRLLDELGARDRLLLDYLPDILAWLDEHGKDPELERALRHLERRLRQPRREALRRLFRRLRPASAAVPEIGHAPH